MTIVVGVATPEGLVLAADSRTTVSNGDHHRIASDNAQKVFAVAGMGIATYGAAFIENDTIAGVMDQFAAQMDGDETESVEDFATQLGDFYNEAFGASPIGKTWDVEADGYSLGFVVAGYSADGIGAIYEVMVPFDGQPELLSTTTGGGLLWRGQTEAIRRLIKGVDYPGIEELGLDFEAEVFEKFGTLEFNLLSPITLQDGVDFASFLVRTTIDMQRFSNGTQASPVGVPGCGGPLQVLAVERSKPTWVRPNILHGPSEPGLAEGAAS